MMYRQLPQAFRLLIEKKTHLLRCLFSINDVALMIAAVALLLIAVIYRTVLGMGGAQLPGWIPNFSPVAAIALCGAIYLPRRMALALPLTILLLSDLIINAYHDLGFFAPELLPRYIALAVIVAVGFALRSRAQPGRVVMMALGCSVLFYVITNTGSWLTEPGYAKNMGGWLQAMTTGLPGYPPTWIFFRNTVVSDLLFTALFVVCAHVGRSRVKDVPQLARAR
jgi:hypothetical protein